MHASSWMKNEEEKCFHSSIRIIRLPSGSIDKTIFLRDFTLAWIFVVACARNMWTQPKMKLEIDCLSNINMSRQSDKKVWPKAKKQCYSSCQCLNMNAFAIFYFLTIKKKVFSEIFFLHAYDLSEEQEVPRNAPQMVDFNLLLSFFIAELRYLRRLCWHHITRKKMFKIQNVSDISSKT